MRIIARETLFKIIFASQFSGNVDEDLKNHLYRSSELDEEDVAYCENILDILSLHTEELVKSVDEYSVAFPEKRIFPADKSILLIALAEMRYCPDIPNKVSLNEAADIASKYSSEKSASFITGILSAIDKGAHNV